MYLHIFSGMRPVRSVAQKTTWRSTLRVQAFVSGAGTTNAPQRYWENTRIHDQWLQNDWGGVKKAIRYDPILMTLYFFIQNP